MERAQELAGAAGDRLVMSYVVRHLGFVDAGAGRLDRARERFEESVRLRRAIVFRPGVAAGLVALVELAVMAGDRARAESPLQEASTICQETDAKGAMRWVSQVQHDLA